VSQLADPLEEEYVPEGQSVQMFVVDVVSRYRPATQSPIVSAAVPFIRINRQVQSQRLWKINCSRLSDTPLIIFLNNFPLSLLHLVTLVTFVCLPAFYLKNKIVEMVAGSELNKHQLLLSNELRIVLSAP